MAKAKGKSAARRAAKAPAKKTAPKGKPKAARGAAAAKPLKSKPKAPPKGKAKAPAAKPKPSAPRPATAARPAKPPAAKPAKAAAEPAAKAAVKAAAAKPAAKATAKPQPLAAGKVGAARPALPPPAPPASQARVAERRGRPKAGGAEPLTLVPARTSAAARPAPAAPPPRARTSSMPPKGGVTLVRRQSERPVAGVTQTTALPIPVRKLEAPPSVEQRHALVEKRLLEAPEDFRNDYIARFEKSWIYHDSALEGTVYTLEELEAGLGGEPIVTDSTLQPAADEIRRQKEAIEFIRDYSKKRLPITVDVVKKIYLILHPSEGDLKTVKYRRDIPQHRLYFHEYAQPDKIAYKVRQSIDWVNDPETKKTRNALRIAARAHYDLLRVFPFPVDSGKVARLFMNLLLMRAGYPPAIVHATERQRYYDALKGEPNVILRIVQESVENGLASVEKILDERDTKTRAFVS